MASTFRFLHAADLHLDTPFDGIGRVAPAVASLLRDASLQAWDALVDLALREHVAFVVLAGDIYDGADRGLRAQLRVLRGLERLSAARIPTLIVHGNHDPVDGWTAIREWPPHVTVFPADEVQAVVIELAGEPIATIHGISYGQRDVTENLARRFQRGSGPGFQLGLLHANVGADGDHAAYSPCTLDDLFAVGMDYWALGHIHSRRVLSEGPCWVVYPGNLQGRSPKASETGAKGACIVRVTGNVVSGVDFEPLDVVRFAPLEIDIAAIDDIPTLRDRLLEEADTLRHAANERGLLLRATLRGRARVHADLTRPDVVDDLLKALREESAGREPLLWWESLRDETQPPLNRPAIRERGDLSSDLLRVCDELRADPAALERLADEALGQLSAVARGQVDRMTGAGLEDLLQRAEQLALELLEDGR